MESLLLAALNHVLPRHAWARQRLAVHAGRSARLTLSPLFTLDFSISAEGLLAGWEHDGEAPPEVELGLPLAQLPALLDGGVAALMNQVRIEGNADFAEALGFVFRHLDWDAEEELSRLIGDIGAHRVGSGVRMMQREVREVLRRSSENLTEYLVDEAALLTAAVQLENHQQALIELRDRLGRLQQRVERLERRARG